MMRSGTHTYRLTYVLLAILILTYPLSYAILNSMTLATSRLYHLWTLTTLTLMVSMPVMSSRVPFFYCRTR
jgi:hypothetical protein